MTDKSECCGNCTDFHEFIIGHIGWCEYRKKEGGNLEVTVTKDYMCSMHKPVEGKEGEGK